VTVWENEAAATVEYRREQEILGDFPGGLKDLATHRRDVQEALVRVFQYWIDAADFDGFRIDTLKHQEPEFFEVFAPAMRKFAKRLGKDNFFMFGEAFDGNDALLGSTPRARGSTRSSTSRPSTGSSTGFSATGTPPSTCSSSMRSAPPRTCPAARATA
jgi:glycosidase